MIEIELWVSSQDRFFPVPCPHYHATFKTDLKSLGKPTVPRVLTSMAVSIGQFGASAMPVISWRPHFTLHAKKSKN